MHQRSLICLDGKIQAEVFQPKKAFIVHFMIKFILQKQNLNHVNTEIDLLKLISCAIGAAEEECGQAEGLDEAKAVAGAGAGAGAAVECFNQYFYSEKGKP